MDALLSEPELLRCYLADKDAPCPRCGYSLRGLVGRVCPECSEVVELTLSRIDPLWRYRRLAVMALALWAGFRLFSGAWLVVNLVDGNLPGATTIFIRWIGSAAINLGVGGAAAWGLWRLARRWRRGRTSDQPVAKAAVLVLR